MSNQIRAEVGHRAVPNVDDIALEAWAPGRSGCLEELVRAVVSTFADADTVPATREVPLEVGAARDADVVVALVDGTFFVAPVEEVVLTGAGPKGISRADVQFAFDGTLWRGSVHVEV